MPGVDPRRSCFDRAKRLVALAAGVTFITLSVLTLLDIFGVLFDLPLLVRSCWNCCFGLLMVWLQLRWRPKFITKYFGFLDFWLGRGMFYLFVGTNGLLPWSETTLTPSVVVSYATWAACWFVAIMEFLGPRTELGDVPVNTEARAAAAGDSGASGATGVSPLCSSGASDWSAALAAAGGGAALAATATRAAAVQPANPFLQPR